MARYSNKYNFYSPNFIRKINMLNQNQIDNDRVTSIRIMLNLAPIRGHLLSDKEILEADKMVMLKRPATNEEYVKEFIANQSTR